MARYVHKLDEVEHDFFLKQGRKDFFTKEVFKVGDKVVLCAKCKAAFFEDVWIQEFKSVCRNNGCHSTDTLPNLPKPQNIFFSPPKIFSFTSNKREFHLGEAISLTWNVRNADVVKIGNKIVSEKTNLDISLLESSQLKLWVRNNKGTSTKELSIRLLPPEITNFSSNKKTIFEHEPIVLSWNIIGANSFSLRNNYGEYFYPEANSLQVKPRQNTVFYLEATNGEHFTEKELTLKIKPIEIVSFFSKNEFAIQGEEIRLEWEVLGAVNIEINNGIGMVKSSGFLNYQVGKDDIEFELLAKSEYGVLKKASTNIKVLAIESIGTTKFGEDRYKFRWKTKHLDSTQIFEETGNVPISEEFITEDETEFNIELCGNLLNHAR